MSATAPAFKPPENHSSRALRVDLAETVALTVTCAQIDTMLETLADNARLAKLYVTLVSALDATSAAELAGVPGQEFELIMRSRDAVALLHTLDTADVAESEVAEALRAALASNPTLW